jgi:sec-independent protein translocase protein TatA
MFGLGAGEIFLIVVAALIFVGPKKLPELAKGLGKGIREFQKAKDDLVNEVKRPEPTAQVEKKERP